MDETNSGKNSTWHTGLVAFCSPYFINPKALNWGIKYCWIWAGSNLLTFGESQEHQALKVLLVSDNLQSSSGSCCPR